MRDVTPKTQNVFNLDLTTTQSVAVGASSTASANAIGANAVLLASSTNCYLVFGVTPTATTAGLFLPANMSLALEINPLHKVAAIRATADGILSVIPIN